MKEYPGAFGDLSAEYCQHDKAAIAILPIPYDETSSWMKGSRHGPQALLEASANMELYDIETDSEVFKRGIVTLPPMRCPKPPSEMVAAVYDKAVTILEEGKFLVGIGGEHTVSVGLVRAAAERYRNLSVIQFDAHSDRRDTYGGEKYSHACVMARIGEICPFVQVGIRSMDVSEKDVLDSSRTFFAHDIINGRDAVSGIVDNLSENVYLSVDLDVFDPSVMPSTGTPEPGGLDWQTINELIASVVEEKNVVAADITELLPHPSNRAPDFLAAKLLYRILSMVFCGK